MTFSVVINSSYAIDTGALYAQRDYNIDWSIFEEGDYELSFSFESGFQEKDTFNVNSIPHSLSLPDLPLKNIISPVGGRAKNSSVVGVLSFNPLGDGTTFPSGQQYSSNPNNKPVVCNRPSAQEFRVRFLGITGEEITLFTDYTLILYFKKL